VFAAGADSGPAAIRWMISALALHPEVQKRGQDEVDAVTQGDRLPQYSDRAHMPYVNAIVKELARWNPMAKLTLPHVVAQDDEYKGYHIPKGAIVFANMWSILRDPVKYPEPHKFNPDRFLDSGGNTTNYRSAMNPDLVNEDPWHYNFGFGPRQCPGRYLIDAQIWLLAANLLATVNVSKLVDKDGHEVYLSDLKLDTSAGTNQGKPLPKVHGCTVEYRSPQAAALMSSHDVPI